MLRYVRRVHWDEIRWMRQMWDVCILGDWVWTHTHTLDWWISSCVCVCVYTTLVFWTLKFVAWIIPTCAPKIESICYWQREEWRPKRPKWTMSVTKFNLILSRWFCGFRLSKYLSLSACSSMVVVLFIWIRLPCLTLNFDESEISSIRAAAAHVCVCGLVWLMMMTFDWRRCWTCLIFRSNWHSFSLEHIINMQIIRWSSTLTSIEFHK